MSYVKGFLSLFDNYLHYIWDIFHAFDFSTTVTKNSFCFNLSTFNPLIGTLKLKYNGLGMCGIDFLFRSSFCSVFETLRFASE